MDTAPEREPLELRVELHPFLVGLRSHHIRLLADCAMARSTSTPVNTFFGRVNSRTVFTSSRRAWLSWKRSNNAGTCVVVEKVGAGKLVGWSWLFPPYIWHFDARATEPTSALFFYGTILREYCAKDPSLGFELFKRMSQVMIERLQSARARLLSSHSNQGKAKSPAKQRQ